MPKKDDTKKSAREISKFIKRHLEGGESVAALVKEYGVSRATAYNWLVRHRDRVIEESDRAGMSPASIEKADKVTLRAENARLKLENAKLRNKLVSLMIKAGNL